MLHPDLMGLLAATDAAEADAKGILNGLTDAQANWQPDNGSAWSIAQCLDHLAAFNVLYVAPFLQAIERARTKRQEPFRGLAPSWFGRKFISTVEPPSKMRAKTPSSYEPKPRMSVPAVLEAYCRSHEEYRRLVRAANEVDVNKVTAPNPILRPVRMRIATVLLLVPAHNRRHLWQARQVLLRSEFPH